MMFDLLEDVHLSHHIVFLVTSLGHDLEGIRTVCLLAYAGVDHAKISSERCNHQRRATVML